MISNFIYNISPYPIKSFIASNYGYYLKYLRYSGKFEKYKEEALQRDSWTKEKWDSWQESRLAYMLKTAYHYVPFYKDYWSKQRRIGNNSSHELIENWPVINKKIIQKNPELFINSNYNRYTLVKEYTSGSSGSPLRIYHSLDTLQYWYGLCEARWRKWYDLNYTQPWAYIAGRKVTPYNNNKPPFWVWNKGLKQLYLSCYHLKKQNIPHYMDAMKNHEVVYLYGLASSINQLAYHGKSLGLNPPNVKAIVSCAETLYLNYKKNIEDYFSCPVYDSYGSTEKVIGSSECTSKQMHIWPDAGKVEICSLHSDLSCEGENSGRLICTGLINEAMPLIRYDIGDIGMVRDTERCVCNRNMPILSSLEGRFDDMILTPDGRRVMVIWSFLNEMPIIELQVVQEDIYNIRINYIAENKLDSKEEKYLIKKLEKNLGEFNFHFYLVDKINRSENGKFKAVISHL